jgi:HSP20 family protein
VKKVWNMDRTLMIGILVLQAAILVVLVRGQRFGRSPAVWGRVPSETEADVPAGDLTARSEADSRYRAAQEEVLPVPEWFLQGVPYDPWRDARRMHAQMQDMFDDVLADFGAPSLFRDMDAGWSSVGVTPSVDMREGRESYVVVVTLPGVEESQVAVMLEGRLLSILAPLRRPGFARGRVAAFEKKLQIPGPVDAEGHVRAGLTNGVLRVVIPKGSGEKTSGARVRLL